MTDLTSDQRLSAASYDRVIGPAHTSTGADGGCRRAKSGASVPHPRPSRVTAINRRACRRRSPRGLNHSLISVTTGTGYGAAAPTPTALRTAARFIQGLLDSAKRISADSLPMPDVMASVSGGVLLEWESDEVDLFLDLGPNAIVAVYVRRADSEEEGPLLEHHEAVADALDRLSIAS